MNEREYRALRRTLDAEYHKNVEALDRVWRLAHLDGAPLPTDQSVPQPPAEALPSGEENHEARRAGSGDVIAAVREAIEEIEGRFTWVEVSAGLEALNTETAFKRPTINQVLRRLVHERELAVIEKGRGKRASVYQKSAELPGPTRTRSDV